jgi:nucleotide-binding universal stress UspA family protein
MSESSADFKPIPAAVHEASFKKVLLATDFSDASQAAFQAALRLCISFGASLSILHVFEYAVIAPPKTGGELIERDSFYERAQLSLDNLVQTARRAGVICTATIASGIPHLTILDAIGARTIDLAVLGTRSLHGFERLVFGSTAEAVLRGASCPVFTVGPQVSDPLKAPQSEGAVVFATDFELSTTHAIRLASFFSEVMGAPLHCLHVLPRRLEGGGQSHIVSQIMTEALQHVATESGTTIDRPVCAVTYGSEISNAVVDYAKEHKAKLIVLGVRQASMAASHIPAHIAFRVIAEAQCPVLTMAYSWQASGIAGKSTFAVARKAYSNCAECPADATCRDYSLPGQLARVVAQRQPAIVRTVRVASLLEAAGTSAAR